MESSDREIEPRVGAPSLEQHLLKEGVIDNLEKLWMEEFIEGPLRRMETTLTAKRRKAGVPYSDMDEALDRVNFSRLREEYVAYITSLAQAQPRTPEERREIIERREKRDSEFYRRFSDLDLGIQYEDIAIRPTVFSLEMERGDYLYRDKVTDVRPGIEYYNLAELLERFLKDPNSLKHMWPKDLIGIHSFDRWVVLKKYLQEEDLVSKKNLDVFEDLLIKRLVEEVLIPGGYESWDGTSATVILRKLGSVKALEPLLYYQTLVSGAHGLYSAGHTNAAAQLALESILRNTPKEKIERLSSPRFVREALVTLKDIAEQPVGDEYGRSYLTAGLVARKFKESVEELKKNYEDPNYRKWVVALFRGMKNSQQPFSAETYDIMLSFLDDDKSVFLQQEVIQVLAFRIHNQEKLGINVRINPDFSIALESLLKVIDRKDFVKSPENLASIYHIVEELQTEVELSDLSEAEIAKIKLFYARGFHTTVGIPSKEQSALSLQYRDSIVNKLLQWMDDGTSDPEIRYMILQIFDLVGHDYPNTVDDISQLYGDHNLAQKTQQERLLPMDRKINFLRDINRHGYYECLTDLLLRRYLKYGDLRARDLIVRTYLDNPSAKEGIVEWFKHWDLDKYIEENPDKMHSLFDDFNKHIVEKDDETSQAVLELFDERIYFRRDPYLRDLILADLEEVSGKKGTLLFQSLVKMIKNNEGYVDREIPEGAAEDTIKNIKFGQETMRLIAEKMWQFLNSKDITQQFWVVYTLNLYGEKGDKFREVVDKLLAATHELEKLVPGGTKTLDKIKERLES